MWEVKSDQEEKYNRAVDQMIQYRDAVKTKLAMLQNQDRYIKELQESVSVRDE